MESLEIAERWANVQFANVSLLTARMSLVPAHKDVECRRRMTVLNVTAQSSVHFVHQIAKLFARMATKKMSVDVTHASASLKVIYLSVQVLIVLCSIVKEDSKLMRIIVIPANASP